MVSLSQIDRLFRRTTLGRLFSCLSYSSCTPPSTYVELSTHHRYSPSDSHHFMSVLQRSSKDLRWVCSVHAQIVADGLSADQALASKLIRAYFGLGNLGLAGKVFDQFPSPKVVLSNAMVSGYIRHERYDDVIRIYKLIKSCNGLEIDSCTVSCALKSCTLLSDYETGYQLIRDGLENGMESNLFFGSAAITFLVEFGDVDEARRVFDSIPQKDVVCWNSMIGGYAQCSRFHMAFRLFLTMYVGRVKPNSITMMTIIQACGAMNGMKLGVCVHALIMVLGLGSDVLVLTSLVDMYHELGKSDYAHQVFKLMPTKNLISWNAMISGCVRNGLVSESIDVFRSMVGSVHGFDATTLVSLLQGCSQIGDMKTAKIFHGYATRRKLVTNHILSTALLDLYAKFGTINQAMFLFGKMEVKNVVTWTALLVGLAQNGHAEKALKLFKEMQEDGIVANAFTLVGLLQSCAQLGCLKNGKSVHAYCLRHGFNLDAVCTTALIDMYFKCGKINCSLNLFSISSVSDVGLWNSMITGYGTHGNGIRAIDLLERMTKEGVRPNETTFLCLLSACSHSGLIDEGLTLFNTMKDYNISPTEKHYSCVVDLLSRAGQFDQAEALIQTMPFEPGSAVLEALLSGCRTHKNTDLGVRTADKLMQMGSLKPCVYVLLSNMYAAVERWDEVGYIRSLMSNRGLKKVPGFSAV